MITQNNINTTKMKRGNSLNSKKREKLIFYISMMALPVAQFLVFYLYVNFDSFALAFKEYSLDGGYIFAGFKNFNDVFQNFMSFSSIALVERQCQGSSKRERLGTFSWLLL